MKDHPKATEFSYKNMCFKIAYKLDNGTYTARLTLYDENGATICTREMKFEVSDM